MKRILCIILAILMLTPTAFADTPDMTYRIKGGEGKVGDVVKVVLEVEGAPACVAYETTLSYDPAVLQPTGDYQKMYLNGLMVVNTNADVDGKKMVKVAAVAVQGNLLEGNMELLNISFKIIGTPAEEQGSLIDVYDYTFSQNDEKMTPVPTLLLLPGRVKVVEKEAAAPDAAPEATPETKPEKEEPKKDESSGDWYFDGDQAIEYFPDNSKDSVQYDVEYEKDEEGKTTGVILYDKEDKTEAGRLEVDEDEYGNLVVTDKQMKDEGGFSLWFLLPIGAAVLVAVGGVILAIKTKKSK